LSQIFLKAIRERNQRRPIRGRLTGHGEAEKTCGVSGLEASMVRELHINIVTVGLVFLFLGAIVVGVF